MSRFICYASVYALTFMDTGAFNFGKMPSIDGCKEGQSQPASIFFGDQGSQHVQQEPVQGAEEGKPGELDRVPLQLVHCSCHDHTWGQGLDPLTGCPFATLMYYNNNKNRQLLVPNGI